MLKNLKSAFKTASKGPIKKPAEGSVDLIDSKIADKTTKTAYQSNLDTAWETGNISRNTKRK